MSHAEAREACRALGGDLASIHSEAENEEAFALTGGVSARIGLTDAAVEGTFVWEDGTPLDYVNWASGQPNNNGNEDCATFGPSATQGMWYDAPCEANALAQGYICRKSSPISFIQSWTSFEFEQFCRKTSLMPKLPPRVQFPLYFPSLRSDRHEDG